MKSLGPQLAARINELLQACTSYRVICAEIGCTKATVSRYAARIGLRKPKRKLDWAAIRAFYEAGHSRQATLRHFGIFVLSWQKAVRRGDVVPRPQRSWVRPISEVLSAPQVQRPYLRKRLVTEGYLIYECAFCRIYEWRGQPLSLELDHINGDKTDNRLENLRILCPNCHSQTETFSGRNATRRKAS